MYNSISQLSVHLYVLHITIILCGKLGTKLLAMLSKLLNLLETLFVC